MATANPPDPIPEDAFVLELTRVKESIVTKFNEIFEHLDEKQNELLRQIETIIVTYQTYKQELQTANEEKRSLETDKLFHQSQLINSPANSVHDKLIDEINTELEAIATPKHPELVTFVCDKNKLLTAVNELCKLVERVSETYKSKSRAIVNVCDYGTGNEQLNIPRGVTVYHNTGNIYVADCANDCVKVFDSTAKYLFKFGDVKGEGKMSCPRGLLIRGKTVFVSHNHCILVYQLDGKFVFRIGGEGSGELQFKWPCGLSTNTSNNDMYICDTDNSRIQVLTENYQYKSQFGEDVLKYPQDIQLTQQHICVLDTSNPCIHVYSYNHVLTKSMISWGKGNQIVNSYNFFMDRSGNILITDTESHSLSVFNSESQIIHEIKVSSYPTGVVVDNQDRIIVVCQADKNCLLIF